MIIRKLSLLNILLFLVLAVTSCLPDPTASPSPTPTNKIINPTPTVEISAPSTTHIVISEVLAGVSGNNNQEFIELYNPDSQIKDLDGWSLWYRLPSSSEDSLIYRWTEQALIPPQGHYLLTRVEQLFPLSADTEFDQNINTASGGIQLRQIDGTVVDSLSWGTAPDGYAEAEPAKSMQNGLSLERLPGGSQGNNQDTGSNKTDFFLTENPNPQNSGSPITPFVDQGIQLSLEAPELVEPGSNFNYVLTVKNSSTDILTNVSVTFPVLPELTIESLPDGVEENDDKYIWDTGQIAASDSTQISIPVTAPWTYTTLIAGNYYATAPNSSFPIFGSPVWTKVEGGVIPIATARKLIDAELTIEGIATMYTGGYFAGNGNTKFYLEDETGGIQVQVFGGDPSVRVTIGSKVRVRGKIGIYRNSIQIVPINVPDDVEILSRDPAPPALPILLSQALEDIQSYPGRLIQVEGSVTRIEEFTYSYEIDLTDSQNDTLTLYVDKLTNINIESLETGFEIAASGILDDRDSFRLLYPRIQEDLTRRYPELLFLEADTPIAIQPGEIFTVTLTATNHTKNPISDLTFLAKVPDNTSLISVSDQGKILGNELNWVVPRLNGNGESILVNYQVKPNTSVEQITIDDYKITSPDYPSEVIGQPVHLFSSGTVPIWAIQGESFRSPYIGKNLTTQGLVTGVFPELSGFWIQNLTPDESSNSSEGLFIHLEEFQDQISLGDFVEVNGIVREASQQTTLEVT